MLNIITSVALSINPVVTMYEKANEYVSEMYCLSEAVYFESGNQKFEGKLGVSHTILNRVKHNRRWSNTICGVISEPKQFSYKDTIRYKTLNISVNDEEVKAVYDSIIAAIGSRHAIYQDVTKGATNYLNIPLSSDLSWYRKLKLTAVIQNHHFYK